MDPVIPGDIVQQHCFWVRGYGEDKAKDDKLIEMDAVKSLKYSSFRAIVRKVANVCITTEPGPVEIGSLSRRFWNNMREPSINDLRSRVIKKKKKSRAKNLAAKKKQKTSSSASLATSEPQGGTQDQAGDPSPATGENQPDEEEVVMLGEVRHSIGQPSGVPGIAPPPPGVPIIRTPQVILNQAPPPQLGRGNQRVPQPRGQYPAGPRFGNQHVHGRH